MSKNQSNAEVDKPPSAFDVSSEVDNVPSVSAVPPEVSEVPSASAVPPEADKAPSTSAFPSKSDASLAQKPPPATAVSQKLSVPKPVISAIPLEEVVPVEDKKEEFYYHWDSVRRVSVEKSQPSVHVSEKHSLEKPVPSQSRASNKQISFENTGQGSITSQNKAVQNASFVQPNPDGTFSIKPSEGTLSGENVGVPDGKTLQYGLRVDGEESITASQLISNHDSLIEMLEDDSREFVDLDVNEMMPKSLFQDKSFMKLREFFESIVSDLENAQRIGIPLEEVKEEFYYLWDSVQKSHDNLDDLLRKDVELSIEVADTMAKTRNLIRISEDHPEVAQRLGRRLETAWNLVDISEEEERRNSERLEQLEGDITILNRNISLAANMEGRTELNELMKIRRKLIDDRDAFHKEIGRMRTTLTLLRERKLRQVDKKTEYQEMIKYADEEAIAQNEALARETSRKERIERMIEQTTKNIEAKTNEFEEMEKHMLAANSKIDELERNLRDQRILNEVAMREAEVAWTKQDKLKGDVESQIALVERLAVDAYKRQTELKAREDDIVAIRIEGVRAERQRVANQKKCESMQETLESLDQERENLKAKILQLEKDLDKAQKRLEESKKEVEELDKQRTVVNRNLQRAVAVTGEHENQMKINSIAVNNLEGELEGFKREIGGQTDTIHRLERERDYYSHEATKLAHIVASRVDRIRRLDMSIYETKRKLAELEGTLKTQQQNYESAVVEKQYYERALRDTVSEINETGKAIRHTNFEKSGLLYRETDLQNCIQFQEDKRDRLVKETDFFKTEAARMKKMAVDSQRETEALEAERSTLGSAIAEGENEISKQKYYATSADSRKQNYHRRLMQKEQTLKDTWERWRTLHSMVRIGAYHYRNIMKEIRKNRQDIMNLRRVQLHFKGNTNHIVQLQQEISALENCIAKETCMVNALEDELIRPINIHRWRVLEAVDPEAYQLVKKISTVTKRLVNHNEQIRKQNLRISDQEHIYVDIKTVMKHLPGLETPEERQYYEVLYEAKKQQLAALKQEINANEAQTQYFRNQVAQFSQRMEELKQEYFKRKLAELCRKTGGKDSQCWVKEPIQENQKEIESKISIFVNDASEEWDGEDANYEYIPQMNMDATRQGLNYPPIILEDEEYTDEQQNEMEEEDEMNEEEEQPEMAEEGESEITFEEGEPEPEGYFEE